MCKEWFDRSSYDNEPAKDTCSCGNIIIEVEVLGDEKPLFKVTYRDEESIYKIPKIK